MRYIVVCAGENHFKELYEKKDGDFIISVDGGYNYIREMNIIPDVHLGDNDSSNCEYLVNKEIIKYNPIKDESDLELAILYINKIYNKEEVVIYNATGNRLDHFEANIRLILKYSDMNLYIVDNKNKVFLVNSNDDYIMINKNNYKYISFFNYEDDTVITLEGFKYNLNNYKLRRFDNLCLSNEVISIGKLKANKPLLCIQSKDK